MEIHLDVPLPGTPEQVWEAVATGPGLATWFMAMPFDPDSDLVTAHDPPKLLTFELPDTRFDYAIEPGPDSDAVLHFTHLAPGDDRVEAITTEGWRMYFATLAEYLTHFPGQPATYIEAEAGAPSSEPVAWPKLLTTLGLDGDERVLGTPVEIVLATGALHGEVDYVTPDYVGIRTDDSLIRFHGRSALDMPIAVSHRRYGPGGADPATVQEAWTAWFGEVVG